jgi:two-component system sensor histidine kinase BaeS
MGIRLKLISFLLIFGFIILGALLWTNQFVTHKTILEYVDQRDQQRLDRLEKNLEIFLTHLPTSLDKLHENDWLRLVFLSQRMDLSQTPPVFLPILLAREFRLGPLPNDAFAKRVSLSDLNGKHLFGPNFSKTSVRIPVTLGEKKIAEIGYHPIDELIEKADIEFAQTQSDFLALGSLFIVLLALLLLWPITNHFLTPIRQLKTALHALAAGRLNRRLEIVRKDELGDLQRDFNRLAETLEAAQKSRNQWIADISHELRTPLTIINGSIEAMTDGVRPMNSANLEALQKEATHLTRLINDLYQLSLSDAGGLHYQMHPIELGEWLAETTPAFARQAQKKGLNWSVHLPTLPCWIEGDETRLNQLLSNLLKNAMDYTDARQANGEPGQIQLSLTPLNQGCKLIIEDSAPGVSDTELSQLTERFYRTEPSRNRRLGGAGLGLAMVKQICEAHQISLEIRQSTLGGLRIALRFPGRKGAKA